MVKKGWFSVRRYLKKITDKELEKRLCQRRSLLDLEDAIGQTPGFNYYDHYIFPLYDQLEKLQDERNVSKRKEILEKLIQCLKTLPQGVGYSIPNQMKEVEGLLEEVLLRVTAFFGCRGIESFRGINYSADISSAYYSPWQKIIFLKKEGENIQGTFIHEYTHHLQTQILPKVGRRKDRIFAEGHAINVSLLLAPPQEKESMTDYCLLGLIKTYNWLAPQFSRTPLPFPEELYLHECNSKNTVFIKGKPCVHELGSALFTVLESCEGPGIYKAMLHGEYDW